MKINLYLRGLHPLATTGLIPLLLLVILNIKVVRGINILTQKRTRKKYPEVDATSLTTEDLVKLNQGIKKPNLYIRVRLREWIPTCIDVKKNVTRKTIPESLSGAILKNEK